MNYTNLNIKSSENTFKYIVEYYDNPGQSDVPIKYYRKDTDEEYDKLFDIFFFNPNEKNVCAYKNYWKLVENEDTSEDDDIMPSTYNISSFNLYFPRYGIETFEKNVYYVMTINTWINNTCVYLGAYFIDRKKAIAPEHGRKQFLNTDYYEYVNVKVVDPFYLIYGDDWKDFRIKYCEEIDGDIQKNNTGSNINITLTPVKLIDGIWVKLDGYDSSQSALEIINHDQSNYFTPVLTFNNEDGNAQFDCNLIFNKVYEDLENYLLETYQIVVDEHFKMKYGFVIGDKTDPYRYVEHVYETAEDSTTFPLNEFAFESWADYRDGLRANVYVIFQKDGIDVLAFNSNSVFITQDVFRYLLNLPLRHINKDELIMTQNNYDVVNIIKNEIVTVDRPNDSKSNIIKPIFVKVQDTDTIRLHRGVTENIVINLDAYKNKVKLFNLKIGDGNFYEIARISSGIVFKVVGTALPDTDGIYYILNSEGELVTTGKYVIAQ